MPQYFSYIVVVSFIRGGQYTEKTTDLPQVTDKVYHICCIEYTSPEYDLNSQI